MSTRLQSEIIALNPDGYWRFNETAGATAAVDQLGLTNLSASGSVTFGVEGAERNTGTALRIQSSGGYVASAAGSLADYSARSPFSFHFWLRMSGTQAASFPRIVTKERAANTGLQVLLGASSRAVAFTRRESSGESVTDPTPLPADTWVNYVWTYDGTTQRLYRNGATTPVATTGSTQSLASMAAVGLAVGARSDTFGDRPNMRIDELAVFNYALTADAVSSLYVAAAAATSTRSASIAHQYLASRRRRRIA